MGYNIKPVYIKVVGDALLPLLGYFLWDWNVYFILVFYMLDILIGEVLIHLKTKKIKSYSEKIVVTNWIKQGVFSMLLVLVALLGMHLAMRIVTPSINFLQELYLFMSYEEMGIAQGYVLLPLIIFMGYSQYKNEFIVPKQFRTLSFSVLWKKHIMTRIFIILLLVLLSGIAYFIQPAGWIYVIAIVITTSIYQLISAKSN